MPEQSFVGHRHRRAGFLERMAGDLLAVLEHALVAEGLARRPGLLQRFDPRVRLFAILALIGATVAAHSLAVVYGLLLLAALLARLSHIPVGLLARGIWLSVLLFTGILALPALFLVPGEAVARLPGLGWAITAQGLASAAFLVGRALAAASFAALLILATPWPHLLKALRTLGLPSVLIVILGMTYRYVFLLLLNAHELFAARQSRQVGDLSGAEQRRLVVSGAGALLSRSMHLADEVFLAMRSRGYRGEHASLAEFELTAADWAALAIMAGALAAALAAAY
ncbi:cobalt ECF transporter T component CbiQ [Parasulfuritortus cantonensis]|uniref:Cobalt ECF transporter T component CbiQ n=1 Tax=Parasulfuritortus cantonensis TaxID=2528202 RepID=A0A4R1BNG0_9PROT|nr:cobalt ECF transporter T component CbiQ [Parasulfuritortus cantonensis]TCJ18918.1 cobalt ECF transporter T component CbiQ [Parasulfuritortus cantonensis]